MVNLNNPQLWRPKNISQAYEYVGGPDREKQIEEPSCIVKGLQSFVGDNSCTVEIGCGFGRILNVLAKQNPNASFIGIDFCQDMLNLAKPVSNITYLVSPRYIDSLSVDFIFSHAVCIHNNRQQLTEMFYECQRVLKSGCFMRHDVLPALDKYVSEAIDARQINFPLYPYPCKEIHEISQKTGFTIDRVEIQTRKIYIFKKS